MKRKIPIPLQSDRGQEKISLFHLKLKREKDYKDLLKYQKTSSKKSKKSITGKWLVQLLERERLKNINMLDVGALDGSTWEKYKHLNVESIDLNPLSTRVKKQDFFLRDVI